MLNMFSPSIGSCLNELPLVRVGVVSMVYQKEAKQFKNYNLHSELSKKTPKF